MLRPFLMERAVFHESATRAARLNRTRIRNRRVNAPGSAKEE
jgi:hypothetical protein